MTHDNYKRLVMRAFDKETTEAESAAAKAHLEACGECRELLTDLEAARPEFAAFESLAPSAETEEKIMAAARNQQTPAFAARIGQWLGGFVSIKPALAYAALALVIGALLGTIGYKLSPTPAPLTSAPAFIIDREADIFEVAYPGSLADAFIKDERNGL